MWLVHKSCNIHARKVPGMTGKEEMRTIARRNKYVKYVPQKLPIVKKDIREAGRKSAVASRK